MRGAFLAHIQFFQATPLLMQLFLVFFGGSLFGRAARPWTAALIAFSLHSSAFLGDIWHGSVSCRCRRTNGRRQVAGIAALGDDAESHLPQAGRMAVAPTIGFLVQFIKITSLASIIGFIELVRADNSSTTRRCSRCSVYGFVACVFYVLCWPC